MQSTSERGMTMLEIMVVFALIAIVGGFALLVSMDSLRGAIHRSDRDLIISVLQRARAQAVNNICVGSSTCTDGKRHGVRVFHDRVVLFQTSTDYDHRDTGIDSPFSLTQAATLQCTTWHQIRRLLSATRNLHPTIAPFPRCCWRSSLHSQ